MTEPVDILKQLRPKRDMKINPLVSELREIREGQRCSQDALSLIFGDNARSYMSHLEAGRRNPRLDTLTVWADALGYELKLVKK